MRRWSPTRTGVRFPAPPSVAEGRGDGPVPVPSFCSWALHSLYSRPSGTGRPTLNAAEGSDASGNGSLQCVARADRCVRARAGEAPLVRALRGARGAAAGLRVRAPAVLRRGVPGDARPDAARAGGARAGTGRDADDVRA